MVEETLLETWHHLDGFHSYAGDRLAWLESDEMQGRWCMTTTVPFNGRLLFENAEDRMAFWIRFS